MVKTHLSLTAVAYETGDVLAHVLAYCSLIPQALLVIEGSALLLAESTQRRMEAGSILAGQLTNEAINHTLKRVFRHPRPGGSGREDFGMPSSHSQFMGFFLMATLVLLASRRAYSAEGRWMMLLSKAAIIAGSLLTMISRVYLGYHNAQQVVVGALIGTVYGVIWGRIHRKMVQKSDTTKGLRPK